VLRVVAQGVAVDELLVDQAFGDHHVGHGGHHGAIGAGPDGNPLIGQADGAQGLARVDQDGLRPGLARLLDEIHGVGPVDHLGRVPAPHQDQFGVHPVMPALAGVQGAVDSRRGRLDTRPRIAVVKVEATAEQVQQALGGGDAIDIGVGAGGRVDVERRVAVLLLDADHVLGNDVGRFFPANFLEQAGAARAGALQRGLQAIRSIHTAAVGAAAHTGAQLRVQRVVRTIRVGGDPNDDAILDVGLQHTPPTAVMRAAGRDDLGLALRQCLAQRVDAINEVYLAG